MPDNMDNTKNCISHYCEKLFSTGLLENCEIFLGNVVLYLVRKTLAKRAAVSENLFYCIQFLLLTFYACSMFRRYRISSEVDYKIFISV